MPLEPGEIPQVHRDDRADAMDKHRRDHVRVVDLLAAAFHIGEEAEKAVGDLAVLREQGGPHSGNG